MEDFFPPTPHGWSYLWLLMKKHRALRQLPASLEARTSSLTRMDLVVLEWVEKGKRSSEIAQILGRSERTIHCHVAAILHKVGVETRGAAGLRAARLARRRLSKRARLPRPL